MYTVSNVSVYKMRRLIREYVDSLSNKYLPSKMSLFFNVSFSLENHLAERLIERKFKKDAFERLVTGLVRDHLCEVIYLSTVQEGVRINIHDHTGLMLGVTGRHLESGKFNIKLHTCFIPQSSDKRLVNCKNINLRDKEI